MIKKYCDSCGAEMVKSVFHRKEGSKWSGGSAVIRNTGSGISVRLDVTITATDGTVTLLDICDNCISDAFNGVVSGRDQFRRLASDKDGGKK